MNQRNTPAVGPVAASEQLFAHWGFRGQLERLDGYEDENYRVRCDAGDFVLRISHPGVSRESLETQNLAMQAAFDQLGDAVPLALLSHGGRALETIEDEAGHSRAIRLLRYVPGRLWADARPVSIDAHRELGDFLGRLDLALADLPPVGPSTVYDWDLLNAEAVVGRNMRVLPPGPRAELVSSAWRDWSERVAPLLSQLPRAFVHNDPNDYNLLLDEAGHLKGIIDFGDATKSIAIADLAIALAYSIQHEFDPLACIRATVSAFCKRRRLSDLEQACLPACIWMRLATTVTMAAAAAVREPDNAYLQVSAEPAWRAMEQLAAAGGRQLYETIREASYTAPISRPATPQASEQAASPDRRSPQSEIDALKLARATHLGTSLSLAYEQPLHIVRGSKQFLFDAQGRAYLDCVNNVCHVGHCHPKVVAVARDQMGVLNTNTRYLHPAIVEYAEALLATFPDELSVCYLVCTGSEANELALRMARQFTARRSVIVVDGAYHGNSSSLVELSPYKFDGPGGEGRAQHVHVLDMPDRYRGAFGYDDPAAGENYAAQIDEVIESMSTLHDGPALFACESLLGCGGQIELPPGYLQAAYRRIRSVGGVCLADEVQVGFGRVGSHFWGFETQDVVPDIVTLGKPIGNGHPLAAVVTNREIAEAFDNGMEYFNTFGGNPVSARIGQAVLEVIEQEGLQANAMRVGETLKRGLHELAQRHEVIGDVRGRGLFVGVELVCDRQSKAPAAALASQVVQHASTQGVLISTDGPLHNVLKLKPPMVFTEADAQRVLSVIDEALRQH